MEHPQAWRPQTAYLAQDAHRERRGGIDEETPEGRAVEVTTGTVGDAPMLAELPDHVAPDRDIGSVIADFNRWGRMTRASAMMRLATVALMASCHHAGMPGRGSPQAQGQSPETRRSMHRDSWASRQLGRAPWRPLWRRWSSDHRKSRVDSRMHRIKLHQAVSS